MFLAQSPPLRDGFWQPVHADTFFGKQACKTWGVPGWLHGSGQTSQSLLSTLHFLEETHLGRTWWGCSLRTRSKQTLIILGRWKPHGSFGQENTSLSKTEMSTLQIHNMLYATEIWENCTPVVGLDGSNSIRFSKMCRLAWSNYN